MISLLKMLIRWILSLFKRLTKRQIAKFVGAYVGSALMGTYLTTALFTPASFLNPQQVLHKAFDTGIVNVLSLGLAAPSFEGLKLGAGNFLNTVGDAIGSNDIVQMGSNLIDSANEYFQQAPSTSDDAENPELSALPISPVNNVAEDVGATTADDVAHQEALKSWDETNAPNFYKVLNQKAYIDKSVKAGNIVYGALDDLGRTTRAVGNITIDMVNESAGWRAQFASDVDKQLAGWGRNAKVTLKLPTGGEYKGYFWNRSHLIADSLGGYEHVYDANGNLDKNASKTHVENLITGTRMQNVGSNNKDNSGYGGMAYCENMAIQYLKAHTSCSIWYSVEPVYEGDELIPRANIVKMVSCDGGLNATVIVYNAAKDAIIDYHTGAVKGA